MGTARGGMRLDLRSLHLTGPQPGVGPARLPTPSARRTSADAGIALALAVGFQLLYGLTFQTRQYGDSGWLLNVFAANPDGSGPWYHALYMPVAGLLARTFEWSSSAAVLRFISSGSGALGVALAYGLCRAWSTSRASALVASLLLGLSPAWWFFSTAIEVHTLHAACVGLVACAVLLAPWKRPILAALLVAALMPLLFFSHQTGVLLGPGMVLLGQFARRRRGLPPLRITSLLLLVGPLYLAALLTAIPTAAAMGSYPLDGFLDNSFGMLRGFDKPFSLGDFWSGWVWPLGLLLPLAGVGLLSRHSRGLARSTLLVLLLPSMLFFVVWGLFERGGYTLGTAAFLSVLCARALPRDGRRTLALGALLVALQGSLAWRDLRAFDAPEWGEHLAARARATARALPGRGVLISFDPRDQFIEALLPDVLEVPSYWILGRSMSLPRGPETFVAEVGALVERQLDRSSDVAIDLGCRTMAVRRAPQALPYLDALEAWMGEHYEATRLDDPVWPMLRVRRPRPEPHTPGD